MLRNGECFSICGTLLWAYAVLFSHIYTLFISADGNFRLQRKRKNDDPDDKGLNRGNAYFVDDARFEEYLQDLSTKDVVSNNWQFISYFIFIKYHLNRIDFPLLQVKGRSTARSYKIQRRRRLGRRGSPVRSPWHIPAPSDG